MMWTILPDLVPLPHTRRRDRRVADGCHPQPAAKKAAATAKKSASAAVMIHSGFGPLWEDADASGGAGFTVESFRVESFT
jgi:hypothetical protein